MVQFYVVGGFVRDTMMGVASKDVDYAVVADSFEEMRTAIKLRGKIFQENERFFTIRATDSTFGAADYVWCRKEGPYSDGRHPDYVLPGTLEDDLARRDFTMNAIALSENRDRIIDPFGGLKDIENKVIHSVGDPKQKLLEDALRVMRALRFSITKGMIIHPDLRQAILDPEVMEALASISPDRVREELMMMMKFNWREAMQLLFDSFFDIIDVLESDFPMLWFKPTQEQR